MFAREGYTIIAVVLIISVVLTGIALLLSQPWKLLIALMAALLLVFTLYFFRDPHRTVPIEALKGDLILAPADGRVVVVKQTTDDIYLKGPAQQVSIFLSPLNVHVNRVPADGVVEYENYIPGEYLVAWHEKASEKNERSEIGLLHPSGNKILFKQIAGAVARRIVYHLNVGDSVKAGQRFGIVKFGSRMDVLMPPEVEITARVGDRVKAGISIIGRIPQAAQAVK